MSTVIQSVVEMPDSLEKNESSGNKDPFHRKPAFHIFHKRHKSEDSKNCRHCRKRIHRGNYSDKFAPAHKRRKKELSIPPTKFLLGGNIRDPLNLNSLKDEEVNRRLNAVTPETSPMPTPQWKKGEVEVLIPPNIHDPLNLEGGDDESHLVTPVRKCRKKHKKKKQKTNSESKSDESKTEESLDISDIPNTSLIADPSPKEEKAKEVKEVEEKGKEEVAKPGSLEVGSSKKVKGSSSRKTVDKIVSPVVPQPGAWSNSSRRKGPALPAPPPSHLPTPKFKECNKRFQYGNYNRYYGYRNAEHETDPRLKILETRRDLFEGKEVLDIGCNTGHITLAIAKGFGPKRMVGLDLDRKLVDAAKANVRHYLKSGGPGTFPISMPLVYGPLPPPQPEAGPTPSNTFPHNVSFVQGNYILGSDVLVGLEKPQFDTILCLSVTKWFHLNWGDAGLKRAFLRMFAQLRPGGSLILEPQSWQSYSKKKNITEATWTNYYNISLFPHKFTQFLLSEVGFSRCETLVQPVNHAKGFQRPIRVYTKGDSPKVPKTVEANSACERVTENTEVTEGSDRTLPETLEAESIDDKACNTSETGPKKPADSRHAVELGVQTDRSEITQKVSLKRALEDDQDHENKSLETVKKTSVPSQSEMHEEPSESQENSKQSSP